MKKLLIMIILILEIGDRAYPTEVFVHHNDSRVHFLYHRQKLIKSIAYVESRHNPLAVNVKEDAVGLLQCRPIMLKHINYITGSQYVLSDRLDSLKSIAIFDSLMAHRNLDYDIVLASNLWNRGKYAYDTTSYTRKVLTQYNKLKS